MSWLGGSLSSITGQISNLTKDILTEGTEETTGKHTVRCSVILQTKYVFLQESEILLIKFQIPVVFWAQRKSCDAKPGLGLRLAYQSLASRITPALNSLQIPVKIRQSVSCHMICVMTNH
jgi:hypothetical protein